MDETLRGRINVLHTMHDSELIRLGLYDFRNAENADGIAESSHKNGIYSLTRNVIEFVKVWMNSSKVGYYT